jgi:hypothetical protein
MKLIRICALAAIIVPTLGATSHAVSVCTDTVTLAKPDGCLDTVFNQTNIAGLDAKPIGDTYYFWFGTDIVLARCVRPGETQVMLFAYHQKNDQACPLLTRVKDAIEHGP